MTVMEKPPVIDLDWLLQPVPGENPAGTSLLYAGLHGEIREARRSEDDLGQAGWKPADWWRVFQLTTEALATKTKDLQVAAWLAEAMVKLHGFAGLRDAFKLLRGLHERFWDTLYPEIDEDGLEARANAIAYMSRPLSLPLYMKEIPLTDSATGNKYSYIQWNDSKQFHVPEDLNDLDSEELSAINRLKEQAEEEGKITSDQWRLAKQTTRRAFYEDLNTLLEECWAECQVLDYVMDEKFGRETPGLTVIKRALEDIRSLVENIVKEKRISEPDPVIEPESAGSVSTDAARGSRASAGVAGPIGTREEALRQLNEVAEYFRKTEPHSPVSYLVQRAIKWGQMPLVGWLQDVIKNDAVLDQLRETLGLKTTANEGGPE